MALNLDSSLRVSLHADRDLQRSLDSHLHSRLGQRSRLLAQESRSSGVSLWSSGGSGASSTWPRSPRSSRTELTSSRSFLSAAAPSSGFRSSVSSASTSDSNPWSSRWKCPLHERVSCSAACPFDGSKYRLEPLSYSSHLSSSLGASYSSNGTGAQQPFLSSILGASPISDHGGHRASSLYHNDDLPLHSTGDDLESVIAELDQVFRESGRSSYSATSPRYTHCAKVPPNGNHGYDDAVGDSASADDSAPRLTLEDLCDDGPGYKSQESDECGSSASTDADGRPKDVRSNGGTPDDSSRVDQGGTIDEENIIKPQERAEHARPLSYRLTKNNGSISYQASLRSYGNLARSRDRFPSRSSLYSNGSDEMLSSGGNYRRPKSGSRGREEARIFRLEIEEQYRQYKESYLATSPEQELNTLNTGIVNVRKWLRKRQTNLRYLTTSDSNKLPENTELLNTLISEAKKQQEGVDVLLDRGRRFLALRANIVLEVDLENLVFLWNTYVEGLHKLYVPAASSIDVIDSRKLTTSVKSPFPVELILKQKAEGEDNNTFEEDCFGECPGKGFLKSDEEGNISQDSLGFHDSGSLTLEDLKTATGASGVGQSVTEASEDDSHNKPPNTELIEKFFKENDEDIAGSKDDVACSESSHIVGSSDTGSDSLSHSTEKMELEIPEKCLEMIYPEEAATMSDRGDGFSEKAVTISNSGDGFPSSIIEKKGIVQVETPTDEETLGGSGALANFDSAFARSSLERIMPGGESFSTPELRRRRGLLDTPVEMSNQSSRSESPLSLEGSRSETPTGSLKRADRQNKLWPAIGSIDTFLMDKDILEACKSTEGDLIPEDQNCAEAPSVSFAEFLQQYKELTDWLNQVHKVTQREVTSLSEKYVNQSYEEELLERSPRREFLNNYSRQLLCRYPGLGEQVGVRMSRLNAQWAALERAVAPRHDQHDTDTMLRDLESDLATLRRWLNAVEARLLPLSIKSDWSDAEIEERLQRHKALQRDIESHNKIVNAVLKLSERLATEAAAAPRDSCRAATAAAQARQVSQEEERERDSLQLVALNLQRRWHGIWLQSLEWQCRLEEALTRRKGLYPSVFDFSGYNSLPVLDESLLGDEDCAGRVSEHGLIELEDDSLLFVGHARTEDASRSASHSPSCDFDLEEEEEFGALWSPGVSDADEDFSGFCAVQEAGVCSSGEEGDGGRRVRSERSSPSVCGDTTPVGLRSPPRPILSPGKCGVESPLGKRPYPDPHATAGDASPAKRGSQSPLWSSGGASPVSLENPLFGIGGLLERQQQPPIVTELHKQGHHHQLVVKSYRSLFDRSSGDSANISECESRMGESPPVHGAINAFERVMERHATINGGSEDGEGRQSPDERPADQSSPPGVSKLEVKDVGYSSESQSNDETELMRQQIDLEYKFPGKCEVASDGPLGDKVMLPSSLGVRPDYYCMTHVELDSATTSDVTDSSGEKGCDTGPPSLGLTYTPEDTEVVSEDKSEVTCSGTKVPLLKGHFGEQDIVLPSPHAPDGVSQSYAVGAAVDESAAPPMVPMHQLADFSESDSAPEGKKSKSIRYLIEHAEDLVKPSSGGVIPPRSPTKQAPVIVLAGGSPGTAVSPASKQTQTDSCSTVESSCDASGEDNSDHELMLRDQTNVAGSGREEFSTATDDAEDTLYSSVINMESVAHGAERAYKQNNTFPKDSSNISSPQQSPQLGLSGSVYDQARLRKQTGDVSRRQRQRRGKKDRPWSVVGIQDINLYKPELASLYSAQSPPAASESAINHLPHHFLTDSDSSTSTHTALQSSQSSTFPRSANLAHPTPASPNLSSSRSRRSRHKLSSDNSSSNPPKDFTPSQGSSSTGVSTTPPCFTSTPIKSNQCGISEASSAGEQQVGQQKSPHKSRKLRKLRCRSSLENKEPVSVRTSGSHRGLSSATESYDSAEADTESETADEYLTAPMEAATSEGDDGPNGSGSLSENSTWDNYQMVYPTASEDAAEELIAWEPQDDDLEFDEDFQLGRPRTRSILTDALAESVGQQQQYQANRKAKLKFTKAGLRSEDSDSELEDFYDILGQSELQLRLVDQSLRKRRKDPWGTGLHPNPAKYSEMIKTYETNIKCLESICQYLNSDDVTSEDIKRVKDLMYQWEKVFALASERLVQTSALAGIRDKMATMKSCLEETGLYLTYDRFACAEELSNTVTQLKEKQSILESQSQQIDSLRQQLTDFSSLHPTICVDLYLEELTNLHNSTALTLFRVKEHVSGLEGQRELWLEYLAGQQELDAVLTADRDRLHQLLGLRLTRKDVLTELETLQSSLSVYKSKLAVLGAMRAKLTRSSDNQAQTTLLASLADLRNQLLVVSQRCRQMYRDAEDDDDLDNSPLQPLDPDSDLGKLAMSAAALHEVFSQTALSSVGSPATEAAATLLTSQTSGKAIANSTAPCSDSVLSRSCTAVLRSLPVQVVALVLVAGLAYALDPDILDRLANFTLTVTPELSYVNGPPAV